jgi:uncharacterized protein YbcI
MRVYLYEYSEAPFIELSPPQILSMADNTPTQGQTERTLSQRIQTLYRTHLGLQPSKVICQLIDEKVAIVLENSVTRPEQILAEADEPLAQQVCKDLDAAIRPQL